MSDFFKWKQKTNAEDLAVALMMLAAGTEKLDERVNSFLKELHVSDEAKRRIGSELVHVRLVAMTYVTNIELRGATRDAVFLELRKHLKSMANSDLAGPAVYGALKQRFDDYEQPLKATGPDEPAMSVGTTFAKLSGIDDIAVAAVGASTFSTTARGVKELLDKFDVIL